MQCCNVLLSLVSQRLDTWIWNTVLILEVKTASVASILNRHSVVERYLCSLVILIVVTLYSNLRSLNDILGWNPSCTYNAVHHIVSVSVCRVSNLQSLWSIGNPNVPVPDKSACSAGTCSESNQCVTLLTVGLERNLVSLRVVVEVVNHTSLLSPLNLGSNTALENNAVSQDTRELIRTCCWRNHIAACVVLSSLACCASQRNWVLRSVSSQVDRVCADRLDSRTSYSVLVVSVDCVRTLVCDEYKTHILVLALRQCDVEVLTVCDIQALLVSILQVRERSVVGSHCHIAILTYGLRKVESSRLSNWEEL